ncbi:MAG: hypothetical protein JRJ56_01880, partial [Deltaproteobacteria bacterium]|nr:hypothetical protein [Deltaproteobacteria bacterium]
MAGGGETTAGIYHVVGGGHFGCLAVARLLARNPGAVIRVVEDDARQLRELRGRFPALGDRIVARDAVAYVVGQLHREDSDREWLLPTVPFHLAAAVLE